jgi:hypothetical protein
MEFQRILKGPFINNVIHTFVFHSEDLHCSTICIPKLCDGQSDGPDRQGFDIATAIAGWQSQDRGAWREEGWIALSYE